MPLMRFLSLICACALIVACSNSSDDHSQQTQTQPSKCSQPYTKAENSIIGSGLDGDGSATISISSAVAGKPTSFDVEFTVGEAGIPVGGGVSLGLHHAAQWLGLQITNPNHPGYVFVSSTCSDSLELSKHFDLPKPGSLPPMFKDKRQGLNSDTIFRKIFAAKVINRPLEKGEIVRFSFGSKSQKVMAPTSVDKDHQFRIATDADGDGLYSGIAQSPQIAIIPGHADHLAAVMPAQLQQGKNYEILIRAEDEFYNVATAYNGSVEVRDEQGQIVAAKVDVINGIGRAALAIHTLGPHRLRLSAENGTLTGRSNPLRNFATLPDSKLYWGDIHGHTGISDGLGLDADEYFSFGHDIGGLDVIALTDHGHPDWPANIKAVQDFHQPGKYVTLLAQEAGAGQDHMNLYFRHDDTPHLQRWKNDYGDFYDWVFTQYNSDEPEAITGPHHFSYKRGDDRYPFGLWDDRSARFVEVYSSHGASEFPGNDRALPGATADNSKYLQTGLARGLRFGVIASSDNHDSHPGRTIWGHYPGGLVAFWANELTRDAIWNALWNYSVYATSLDRIYMEFTIDDQGMGKDFSSQSPLILKSYVIGKTDDLTLTVIRDNEEIHSQSSTTGVIELALQDDPGAGEHFYYLRVTQSNKERAWSTPIWVNIDTAAN